MFFYQVLISRDLEIEFYLCLDFLRITMPFLWICIFTMYLLTIHKYFDSYLGFSISHKNCQLLLTWVLFLRCSLFWFNSLQLFGAGQMAHQVKVFAVQVDNLSSVPKTYIKVKEEETRVALSPPHSCSGTCSPSHTLYKRIIINKHL